MDNRNNEFEEDAVSFSEWQGNDGGNINKGKKNRNIIIAVVAVVAVIAIACGVYFGCFYGKSEEESTTESASSSTTAAPAALTNPLTGEADYNAQAVGKRPIAVVIDNASGARPQYNIDTPDIIVEGEVEGGETRMLWLYADMTSLPEMVGPNRSARPSYVQFSELFDSIFVHFGGSHSKGNYVGGYEVIAQDNVDDIDGMTLSSCFKRTSDKVSPHNAVLLGNKLVAAIESKNYRTDINENAFSKLSFNEDVRAVSDTACNSVKVKVSSRTATRTLTYNSAQKVYTNQNDYRAPVSFTNVIVMFADSTYIDKENYKGSGQTETYLNYSLTSGRGQLISCGTVVDFNWSVENGKLSFRDLSGNELNLNPGKSWICLASSNHEGNVTIE